MRRLVVFALSAAALAAVPAAALGGRSTPGDGSLVVKNGVAADDTPVVSMRINGTVIGEVDSPGDRIVIDTGPNPNGATAGVTGAGTPRPWGNDPNTSAEVWTCGSLDGCKFRVVGPGWATIIVYGSDVNLVAIGRGWAKVAGTSSQGGDGLYWLNGADRGTSLPANQTDKLVLTANG